MSEIAPVTSGGPGGVIAEEILCIKCGYNLKMTPLDGRCPECGAPVVQSRQGQYLYGADPRWVATLRNAVTLMLVSMLVGFIIGVFVGMARSPELNAIVVTVSGVVGVIGYWMLTAPEPRAALAEQNVTLRQALRVFAVVNLAAQLLQAAAAISFNAKIHLVASLLGFLGIPVFWLFFLYVSRLARRLPDEILAKRFMVVMWGLTISMVVMFGGILLMAITGEPSVAILACPAVVGLLVFAIWSLVLLIIFRNRLVATATAAATAAASAEYQVGVPQPVLTS